MPARLPSAHLAFRAPCEPLPFASRALPIRSLAIQLQPQLLRSLQHRDPRDHIRPSSSSTRWKTRQTSDPYTKSSKLTALKSRAAYKLLEINDKHKIFRQGQSVVDLGYAPGSWSQVAKNRVGESGRVVGIDLIPAQPPRGVSALQGNFLSEGVQGLVREFVREWKSSESRDVGKEEEGGQEEHQTQEEVRSVVERARGSKGAHAEEAESVVLSATEADVDADVDTTPSAEGEQNKTPTKTKKKLSAAALDLQQGRVVDVVLSDMCAPFPGLELSTWINSVNRPYRRMMNTSGNPFRDHAGSIDLCMAALTFCHDCLVTGGHFLCKFYQGPEDKDLEIRMKKLFDKVHRIKPDSSRKESRESYFVGLRRKADVSKEDVLG